MQPFTRTNLLAVIIAFAAYFLCRLIPPLTNIYADTITRSVLFAVCYGLPVIGLRLSEDINGQVRKLSGRLLRNKK